MAALVERENVVILTLGFVLGGLFAGLVAIMDSPPAHVEHWRSGYEGEQRTARALAPLRAEGYALLHDLVDRRVEGRGYRGNVDHVVVSPAGVFLLDSKWLGGEVSIRGDTVLVQRRDDDQDSYTLQWSAKGVRAQARRLQQSIEPGTGVRFVKAVMVFWNKFDAGVLEGERIVFVHGERLMSWLQEQPQAMSSEWVADVAAHIRQAREPAQAAWWSSLLDPSFRAWAPVAHTLERQRPLS